MYTKTAISIIILCYSYTPHRELVELALVEKEIAMETLDDVEDNIIVQLTPKWEINTNVFTDVVLMNGYYMNILYCFIEMRQMIGISF